MPIKDGSQAEHYHSENRIQVTRRIKAKLAVERGAQVRVGMLDGETIDSQLMPATSGFDEWNWDGSSVLSDWRYAPKLHLKLHRAAYELGGVSRHTAERIINGLNLTRSSNLLFVGATFGWTTEHIKRLKPGISVTSLDTAGWIQSAKDTDEAGDIEAAMDADNITGQWRQMLMEHCLMGPRATEILLEEDCMSNRSRQQVRNAGGSFSHIVTNCLKWQTDAECQALSDALWQIQVGAQIAHIVTPYSDKAAETFEPTPILNWKRLNTTEPVVKRLNDESWYTTNSWKALLPSDTIIGLTGAV